MDALLALNIIKESMSEDIISVEISNDDVHIFTSREHIVGFARFMKDDIRLQFDMLSDLFAVDYPKKADRIEVIYNFYSTKNNFTIFLKVRSKIDEPDYPSLTTLYDSANWFEREVYDMFGLRFNGHPDLKRILNPDDWEGHPLLKDYPLKQRPPVENIDFDTPGYTVPHETNKKT